MADQKGIEISIAALRKAPRETLLQVIEFLLAKNAELEKRIEQLEAKLGENSSNSNKPPSSDSPYKEKPAKKKKRQKKKRKGYQQQLATPTEEKEVLPEGPCSCGCSDFVDKQPYYTHQYIELPEIVMTVLHLILYKGRCKGCGKTRKAHIPQELRTGFGPRCSALIAQIAGVEGNSRKTVKMFCSSVLKFYISYGAIQKVLDRVSKSIKPHYGAIADSARSSDVNNLDESHICGNGPPAALVPDRLMPKSAAPVFGDTSQQ